MSNFYCHPGRAGGPPLEVRAFWVDDLMRINRATRIVLEILGTMRKISCLTSRDELGQDAVNFKVAHRYRPF
jgi:hypothetical protein